MVIVKINVSICRTHIQFLEKILNTTHWCSVIKSCLTLCDPMDYSIPASLSSVISRSLLKFMSVESVMPSNHLVLCRPLRPLPSICPSIGSFPRGQLFTSDGQSFSFSISPSNEHSRLISFMTDWFDLTKLRDSHFSTTV